MSQSSDSLHFDGVTLIEGVVQHSGGIDNLPTRVLVVGVTNEQVLSCEGVRLHVHVRVSHIVNKGWFTNIRETSDNQSSRVSVDLRESTEMLSDFFQITQRAL